MAEGGKDYSQRLTHLGIPGLLAVYHMRLAGVQRRERRGVDQMSAFPLG